MSMLRWPRVEREREWRRPAHRPFFVCRFNGVKARRLQRRTSEVSKEKQTPNPALRSPLRRAKKSAQLRKHSRAGSPTSNIELRHMRRNSGDWQRPQSTPAATALVINVSKPASFRPVRSNKHSQRGRRIERDGQRRQSREHQHPWALSLCHSTKHCRQRSTRPV